MRKIQSISSVNQTMGTQIVVRINIVFTSLFSNSAISLSSLHFMIDFVCYSTSLIYMVKLFDLFNNIIGFWLKHISGFSCAFFVVDESFFSSLIISCTEIIDLYYEFIEEMVHIFLHRFQSYVCAIDDD